MRYPAKTILRVVFPIVVFLISSPLLAQKQPEGDQAPGAKQEVTASAPDLADIIPKAAQLSGDLATLENRVAGAMDISEFEKKFARIEKNLEGPAAELKQIKDSKAGKLNKFFEIRKIIERESELFEDINKPLKEAIRQFGAWRNDWQAEKQHWERWQSALLEDGDLAQLNSTFAKAKDTIDKALEIVNSQLDSVLRVQSRAGAIQAKILVLSTELDALISAARSGIRVNISPPMFSPQYFSQYSSELWYALLKGVVETPWISTRILDRQGWIVFMQVFFSVFVILSIYRNRQLISNSQRWRFRDEPGALRLCATLADSCGTAFCRRNIFWHNRVHVVL